MADRVIFVSTVLVAALYFYATTLIPSLDIGDPLGPKAFPRLLGIALLLGAGLLLAEIWRERPRDERAGGHAPRPDRRHVWVLAAVAGWTALYYATFERAGYVLATAVYLFALMAWFHRGRWLTNAAAALLFSVASYALFLKLEVNLPKGLLPF